jgi:hypothetical protein
MGIKTSGRTYKVLPLYQMKVEEGVIPSENQNKIEVNTARMAETLQMIEGDGWEIISVVPLTKDNLPFAVCAKMNIEVANHLPVGLAVKEQ